MSIKSIVTNILEDIKRGENLDAYAGIILSLVFGALGSIGIAKFEVIASAILAALALTITGIISIKRIIGERSTKKIDYLPVETYSVPTEEYIRKFGEAKEICIFGISLYRFFGMISFQLENALSSGGTVRIVLMTPEGQAIKLLSQRSRQGTAWEVEKFRVEQTISAIERLALRYPKAKLELRTIDYIPMFGITILKSRFPNENPNIYLKHLPFKQPTQVAPTILPSEGKWSTYFITEFENVWDSSERILPKRKNGATAPQ